MPVAEAVHGYLAEAAAAAAKAAAPQRAAKPSSNSSSSSRPRHLSPPPPSRGNTKSAKSAAEEAEAMLDAGIAVFFISAKGEGEGLDELRQLLYDRSEARPWQHEPVDDTLQASAQARAAAARAAAAASSGVASGSPQMDGADSAGGSSSLGVVTSELDDHEWVEECIREKAFIFLHQEVTLGSLFQLYFLSPYLSK